MSKILIGISFLISIGSLILYKNYCDKQENLIDKNIQTEKINNKKEEEDNKENNIKKIDKIILSKKKKNNEELNEELDDEKDTIQEIMDELLESIDVVDRTVTFDNSWQVIN